MPDPPLPQGKLHAPCARLTFSQVSPPPARAPARISHCYRPAGVLSWTGAPAEASTGQSCPETFAPTASPENCRNEAKESPAISNEAENRRSKAPPQGFGCACEDQVDTGKKNTRRQANPAQKGRNRKTSRQKISFKTRSPRASD